MYDTNQEAKNNVYEILHFEPEIVDRMIDFMYTGAYSSDTQNLRPIVLGELAELTAMNETSQKLFLHLRMNCIAEYYDVQSLRSVANREVKAILECSWSDIQLWFSVFVEQVYTCGVDKDLQAITVAVAVAHVSDLKKDLPQFVNLDIPKEFFSDVLCSCVNNWYKN